MLHVDNAAVPARTDDSARYGRRLYLRARLAGIALPDAPQACEGSEAYEAECALAVAEWRKTPAGLENAKNGVPGSRIERFIDALVGSD